jgi:hypothetical protein
MGKRSSVGMFCCAMLLTSSTWAATLEPVQGGLSINQGKGFQPVNNRIDANVGDSVMVSPDGAATVIYGDGCRVKVQPGVVTTIAPLSPCASGSYAADIIPAQQDPPQCPPGETAYQNGQCCPPDQTVDQNGVCCPRSETVDQNGNRVQSACGWVDWGAIAFGVVVAGVTGVVIYEVTQKPASP